MPASPFDRQPNDLGVKSIPPLSPVDPRVPMAEEFALDAEIQMHLYQANRRSVWLTPPLARLQAEQIRLTGTAQLAISADPIELDLQLAIVPLANTLDLVDRLDRYYLVGFGAEVGASQDPLLGQVNFSYQTPNTLQGIVKENSRRLRSFWIVIAADRALLPADVLTILGAEEIFTVTNTSNAGFGVGIYQIYAKDPHLVASKTYQVYPETIEILPIAGLIRRQNRVNRGYTYGPGGEIFSEIQPVVTSLPEQHLQAQPLTELLTRRAINICAGKPSRLQGEKRAVANLAVGSNPANIGRLGEAILSPNGSVATANDQRISFTNQAIIEKLGAYPVVVGNSGGAPLVAIGLNTNAPAGSFFSADPSAHKIYKSDGTEQSSLGSYSNLGGVGSLQWLGTANSTLIPGEIAYIVPAIEYPAGSGLSIPFDRVENVWVDGIAINRANILTGWSEDLDAYADPAANEAYFAVFGTERAALHYIYKKISITVELDGIAKIPPTETGCFAFISGVSGRLNLPVVSSVAPGVVNALIYHAPRSSVSWQLELVYSDYQGLGSSWRSFCEGAVVVSRPQVFAHTQGGGGSVFRGDQQLRYVPIAMHLPSLDFGIPAYELDAPIHVAGEAYQGPIVFRELPPTAGVDTIVPLAQDVLSTRNRSTASSRSVDFALEISDAPVGFLAPVLAGERPYQLVAMFAIANSGTIKMIVATKNVSGGESVRLDPDDGTAIDVFEVF